MECTLIKTVDFPSYDIFIGEVEATHCDESVLVADAVDLERLQPILFAMNNRSYYGIGEKLAKAWSVGDELKK